MTEEIKSRVLTQTIAGCFVTMTEEEVNIADTDRGEGWASTVLTIGGVHYGLVYNIQTWDLTGYTLQDMTLYPQGVLFQDMGMGPGMVPLSPERLSRATIVSNWPLNEEALSDLGGLGHWHLPGSLSSTFNLDNIISGRRQDYFTMTNYSSNVLVKQKESGYGSGDSTAGSKMWFCDAYLFPLVLNGQLSIPDSAVVVPSLVDKEPDLEYMMRLSRSLEPVY
jgi:hypothetical protein